MATVDREVRDPVTALGALTRNGLIHLGDFSLFAARVFSWMLLRLPCRGTLVPIFYAVGVRSVVVVMITGLFIGMVLAIQSYSQFHNFGLDTRLGSIINV